MTRSYLEGNFGQDSRHEVLRKLLTGLIVKQITTSLQKHHVFSRNQRGYLPKRGTDTVNLQLLNTLETLSVLLLLGLEECPRLGIQASHPPLLGVPRSFS